MRVGLLACLSNKGLRSCYRAGVNGPGGGADVFQHELVKQAGEISKSYKKSDRDQRGKHPCVTAVTTIVLFC